MIEAQDGLITASFGVGDIGTIDKVEVGGRVEIERTEIDGFLWEMESFQHKKAAELILYFGTRERVQPRRR